MGYYTQPKLEFPPKLLPYLMNFQSGVRNFEKNLLTMARGKINEENPCSI